MEELKVNVQTDGNEVIVREGKAPNIVESSRINIDGTMPCIGEFLQKRKKHPGYSSQRVDPSKVLVKVERKERNVVLYLNPENPLGFKLTGRLELSDELEPFHINEDKTFKREELVKLLRFNRLLFSNAENHAKVLAAYQSFKANTKADLEAENDTRGNMKFGYKKDVKTNLPDNFILIAPVFKGMEPKQFRVEICLDVTDGGARFWFESVELKEIMETDANRIIDEQLKHCTDFPIIEK